MHAFKAFNNRMRLSDDEEQVERLVESNVKDENALVWTYFYTVFLLFYSTSTKSRFLHIWPTHRSLLIFFKSLSL